MALYLRHPFPLRHSYYQAQHPISLQTGFQHRQPRLCLFPIHTRRNSSRLACRQLLHYCFPMPAHGHTLEPQDKRESLYRFCIYPHCTRVDQYRVQCGNTHPTSPNDLPLADVAEDEACTERGVHPRLRVSSIYPAPHRFKSFLSLRENHGFGRAHAVLPGTSS